MGQHRQKAQCHPDRLVAAKGLCKPCYDGERRQLPRATCHPGRPAVQGFDLCFSCQKKLRPIRMCGTCNSRPRYGKYLDCGKCYYKKSMNACPKCGLKKSPDAPNCRECAVKLAKGPMHGAWKGGRVVDSRGYVKIYNPDHPRATNGRYVLEHLIVMETYLGRPLIEGENVHHRNGDRIDNRIENLELWSSFQPAGQRVEDKVEYAKEILRRYADFKQPERENV